MEKIKLFISYNWEAEQDLRSLLAVSLTSLSNLELLIDRDRVSLTDDSLRERIVSELDACDCILTSYISIGASEEVRSELVRGHEKGKEIIIICDKRKIRDQGDIQNSLKDYLFFLKDKRRLTYTTHEDLINQLRCFFQDKSKKDFERVPAEATSLYAQLKKSYPDNNDLKFRSELTKRIIKEAGDEIRKVYNDTYDTDVSTNKNFLVRAKSIFENSSEVYAFSIDNVSTFWETEANRGLAIDYINSQPKNTVRMFIFSSAKQANRYVNILQANHHRYGSDGRIYICHIDSYKAFLNKFHRSGDINEYFHQDFGILFQEGTSQRFTIEAILDHNNLKFKLIDLEVPEKINYKALMLAIDNMKQLNETDFYKVEDKQQQQTFYIKRWNPECESNKDLWVKDLRKLFSAQHTGEAYHCVCFKDPHNKLEDAILRVKNQIERKSKELGIQSILFGKQAETRRLMDSKFEGILKIDKTYDYLLLMKFSSIEDMEQYYEKYIHGDIRKDLYEAMGEEITFLYRHFQDDVENKKFVFEKIIEQVVSQYMIRHDFVDVEKVETIVFQKRIDFPH